MNNQNKKKMLIAAVVLFVIVIVLGVLGVVFLKDPNDISTTLKPSSTHSPSTSTSTPGPPPIQVFTPTMVTDPDQVYLQTALRYSTNPAALRSARQDAIDKVNAANEIQTRALEKQTAEAIESAANAVKEANEAKAQLAFMIAQTMANTTTTTTTFKPTTTTTTTFKPTTTTTTFKPTTTTTTTLRPATTTTTFKPATTTTTTTTTTFKPTTTMVPQTKCKDASMYVPVPKKNQDLIAYYPFSYTDAAIDQAGSYNMGTIALPGNHAYQQENINIVCNGVGIKDNAGYFDNGYMTVKYFSTLRSPDITVSLWFKTNSTSTSAVTLASFSDMLGSANYCRLVFLGDILQVRYRNGSSIDFVIRDDSKTNLRDNNWHRVIFSFGTSGQKMYVDGDEVIRSIGATGNKINGEDKTSETRIADLVTMGVNRFTIGGIHLNRAITQKYTGYITDVIVCRGVKTANEIDNLIL